MCWVSPYICTLGVDGFSDPEMIILPDNEVFPIKVLLPVWVVEPVIFKLPVNTWLPVIWNVLSAKLADKKGTLWTWFELEA